MQKANCISLRYEEGQFYLSQKASGKESGRVIYKGGYKKTNRGTGWFDNVKPSKLILSIQIEGRYYETWIDQYFKENVGRLTNKRVSALSVAMPSKVNVHECEKFSGDIYYIVDDQCLKSWQIRAGF